MQNFIHTLIDPLRDRFAPLNHTSNFRATGQITPEEFQAAGDFLVYKFPSWSWADAASPSQRVNYFPAGKQYLVTRGVPCKRRVKGGDGEFLGGSGEEEMVVRDILAGPGEGAGDDEGWLKAGGGKAESGGASKSAELMRDVRTVDEDGKVGEKGEEEDEIPDMEDEEDDEEAIIRDKTSGGADEGCVLHSPKQLIVARCANDLITASAPTPSTSPTRPTTVPRASTSSATTLQPTSHSNLPR